MLKSFQSVLLLLYLSSEKLYCHNWIYGLFQIMFSVVIHSAHIPTSGICVLWYVG
jgi:hypothetical protein